MGAFFGRKVFRLEREDLILAAIDYQEKLLPAMDDSEAVEKAAIKLFAGLNIFEVPKLVTTQYARGLGRTVTGIAAALGEFEEIDKKAFSALKAPAFADALNAADRNTVILAGIETHICVEQTALDLLEEGYDVIIAADCCGSRNPLNHRLSVERLREAGAVVTSGESILYEILGGAGAPEFKAISAIVK